MRGKLWLLVGIAVGIVIGFGHLGYFAGAAGSLSDTAERLVGSAGHRIITAAASHGAPRRVVLGVAAVLALLVPGVTALLLMIVARGSVRLKGLVALILVGVGIAGFFYLSGGTAVGVAALAFVAAAVAMVATGPLLAAPLAALAAVIGAAFLPRLLDSHSTLANAPVAHLHQALFATAGSPLWLRVVVLVAAAVPFGGALRVALA